MADSQIKNVNLAKKGRAHIEWSINNMPVLGLIKDRFRKQGPLKGRRIACCLHVTSETAALMLTLKVGGADLALCASNPLSTQDDVAAALAKHYKISVFAIKGENRKTYYQHIKRVLEIEPDVTMDDGADLVSTMHKKIQNSKSKIQNLPMGGTEETTTGVIRLRALERSGELRYPIIAVNDAQTKYMFDNRYGTGQSTVDGIMRSTNKLIAGCNFVICGYGWCGRGIAKRAQGMGAKVVVCETKPLRALEATMDGYEVLPIMEAIRTADIIVTTTGDINVIGRHHFLKIKDGAILANSGHFNVEIDIPSLKDLARRVRRIRDYVEEYTLKDGRRLYLLAEGRLVNLACAEGHPSQVMDMSFANQALSAEFIVKNHNNLEKKVYNVPEQIDEEIAQLKLKSMGIRIDSLTEEQSKYLSSWQMGT